MNAGAMNGANPLNNGQANAGLQPPLPVQQPGPPQPQVQVPIPGQPGFVGPLPQQLQPQLRKKVKRGAREILKKHL